MKPRFIFLQMALIPSLAATTAAGAEPSISIRTTYYSIAGTTSAELKSQMRSLGPQGYWAYTTWYVRWTGDCHVSVEVSYNYPRWTNQSQAPAALQAAWTRMISSLRLHEQGHAQHAKNAAAEIERSHCQGDPKSITQRWAEQDKVYDAQTEHGRTQGVVLP